MDTQLPHTELKDDSHCEPAMSFHEFATHMVSSSADLTNISQQAHGVSCKLMESSQQAHSVSCKLTESSQQALSVSPLASSL